MLQSIRILDSYAAPNIRNTKGATAEQYGNDPKTLLELLQRAARLWPSNGIMFKDQGWDQGPDSMTYADLLEEAKVRLPTGKTKINSAD